MPQPGLIVERFYERLSLLHPLEDFSVPRGLGEREGQLQPEVDGQDGGLAVLGKMSKRGQGPLDISYGFAGSRAGDGPESCLPQVPERLRPHLAPERVVGKSLDVFGEAVGMEPLDGLGDLRVEIAATLAEQAAVGDFVCQRVLERVLGIRKEGGLVEELGRPEAREHTPQVLLAEVGHRA